MLDTVVQKPVAGEAIDQSGDIERNPKESAEGV